MSILKTLFGQRLRQLHRQKDITQEYLTEATGVSVEFISKMERGINAPSFKTLEKLANTMDIPVKEVFNFPDESK